MHCQKTGLNLSPVIVSCTVRKQVSISPVIFSCTVRKQVSIYPCYRLMHCQKTGLNLPLLSSHALSENRSQSPPCYRLMHYQITGPNLPLLSSHALSENRSQYPPVTVSCTVRLIYWSLIYWMFLNVDTATSTFIYTFSEIIQVNC